MRHLTCLGLVALLLAGSAARLPGQAAIPSTARELPRFTLREIIAGRNDTLARIPGRWLKAAAAAVPDSLAVTAYRSAAIRSGLAPLQGPVLAAERSRHVMGLFRRAELTRAIQSTLADIRANLLSDTSGARFDHLFRPGGEWVLDLHDAALAWAQIRAPKIGWESARRSLAGAHWLPADDSLPSGEAIPRALYGLTVLAATDSAAFTAARTELWAADSVSASATMLLLKGYTESQAWYLDALGFFLTQAWIPGGGRLRSLSNLVEEYWRGITPGLTKPEIIPELRARLFGHPQAVPHYGVPPALFDRLVRVENPSARAWLDQYGDAGLLHALRRLPPGDTTLVLLQLGNRTIRVTSVPQQSRESLNGFLEPRDALAIDPGYSPLLALGAVIHEWQHLVFRRRQLEAFASRLPPAGRSILELPGLEPYLAEGFAEWSTELILAPAAGRWPLIPLGELQKRAGLAPAGLEDQHAMGYALVRALAAALPDHLATTRLLLRHADHPFRIAGSGVMRRAWRKHGAAPEKVFTVPAGRILIPEVTFTIEDGFPDVVGSRILVPYEDRRGR